MASVSNPLWLTDKEFHYHTVCQGVFIIVKDWRVFQKKSGAKQENLVQSAFHQTLEDEFTFQQENNLKYKAKSTRGAYQEDSEYS